MPSEVTPRLARQRFRRRTLHWLRFLQILVSIPKILLKIALVFLLYLVTIGSGNSSIAWVLVLSILDIFLAVSIIVTVVNQCLNSRPDTWTIFKQELMKTLIATWVWLGSVVTLFTHPRILFMLGWKSEPTGSGPADPEREKVDRVFRKIMAVWTAYIVLVMLAFYPALWLAYKDWKSERDVRSAEVGLDSIDEHRIRLISRSSIDSIDDVEQDEGAPHHFK